MDDNRNISSSLLRRSIDHQTDRWDPIGIWYRVSDDPPTYLPKGTPASTPLDAAHGTLFVDAVDGWRFFVPQGGGAGYSEGTLLGEADKITNDFTRRQLAARNTVRGLFLPPLLMGLGLATADR